MQTTANHGARCTPQFILGIIIIAVGVILTLDNLGYLYADEILRYWPVGLIAVGASKLWLWPTTRCTPAARAASTIVRHSSTLSAIGFSTSTCLPRLAARQACAAWN